MTSLQDKAIIRLHHENKALKQVEQKLLQNIKDHKKRIAELERYACSEQTNTCIAEVKLEEAEQRIAELEEEVEKIRMHTFVDLEQERFKKLQAKLDAVRESQYDCPYTDCGCCNAVRQALGDSECPGEPDCNCGLSALRAPQGEDK